MRKIVLSILITLWLTLPATAGYAQAPEGQPYTVQPGDTLGSIAGRFLGATERYPDIVEATNAKAAEDPTISVIRDVDVIDVGQTLWLPAGSPFVGTYTASLPAASSPGREMTLTLNADGTAQRRTDYLNGEAPIEESGTWLDNGDGTATLTLTGRPDGTIYDTPDVITFALSGNTLTATAYDTSLYGSEGLTLQKQGAAAAPATLEPETVTGIYKAMFPGGSSPGLDMTLYLNADNSVRQVSDYLNDEAPIVEDGSWAIENNQVVLTLTGPADQPYDTPVITRYNFDQGVLVEQFEEDLPGAYVTHFLPFGELALGLLPVPYDPAAAEQMMVENGLNGIYKAFLPAATCCGQDITLTLGPTGRAILKTDYLNGEAPVVQNGTWASVDETRLDITLPDADSPLSLERVDGVLQTTAGEDAYGEAGLTLYEYYAIALNSNLPAVTGTVSYQERIALLPEALITVQLVDTSSTVTSTQVIAAQMITAGGQQPPFAFALPYNPRTFDSSHTYVVQAKIEVDGRLQFTSPTPTPVLTQDAPMTVDLVLEPAGVSAATAGDGCAAVPATLAQDTPPERSLYRPFDDEAVQRADTLGQTLTVDAAADDAAGQWATGVLTLLGDCQAGAVQPETVTIYEPEPGSTTVVAFTTVPLDDSITAQEVRVDLVQTQDNEWQVDWAGIRWQCARGGDTESLTSELCP